MTPNEVQETRRLALAHRLLEVITSEAWQKIVIPYMEEERKVLIENMADQTDALQLMRFAGSMQTLNSLIHLEQKCRNVVDKSLEKTMSKITN